MAEKMTNEEQTKVALDSVKSQAALMWWVNSVMDKAYRSEDNLQNDFGHESTYSDQCGISKYKEATL